MYLCESKGCRPCRHDASALNGALVGQNLDEAQAAARALLGGADVLGYPGNCLKGCSGSIAVQMALQLVLLAICTRNCSNLF